MKILFQSRVDLYKPRGGDTIQMEKTKSALEKNYPNVKIDISSELYPQNIDEYDIVHLFNLDWVCETYLQLKNAKKHNKPVVFSAIHHSEEDVLKYENLARYDIRRIYNLFIRSQGMRDTWKNLYRSIFNPHKIYPTVVQMYKGIRNQQREIIARSDIVLVQSDVEVELIKKDFKVKKFYFQKVVNGVDTSLFEQIKVNEFNEFIKQNHNVDISSAKIILNVGRIEPRKNQLALIEAFDELKKEKKLGEDWYLILVGDFSDKSLEYKMRFLSAIKKNVNILYVGRLPQRVVASAMAHDGIYVHTSWFESTGLVCIEAALSGMSVVSTGEPIKEYLGDYVISCQPESAASIKTAILKSIEKGIKSNDSIRKKIRESYSWDEVAKQTMSVYVNQVLKK